MTLHVLDRYKSETVPEGGRSCFGDERPGWEHYLRACGLAEIEPTPAKHAVGHLTYNGEQHESRASADNKRFSACAQDGSLPKTPDASCRSKPTVPLQEWQEVQALLLAENTGVGKHAA